MDSWLICLTSGKSTAFICTAMRSGIQELHYPLKDALVEKCSICLISYCPNLYFAHEMLGVSKTF